MTTTHKAHAIHDICDVYPQMAENDLQKLGEDIQAHGLYEEVWLYEGKILDGRNRYLAAQRVGYTIPDDRFKVFEGSQEAAIQFVVSKNHHRRHMDGQKRIEVSMRLMEMLKATSVARKAANVAEANRKRGKNAKVSSGEHGTTYQKGTAVAIAAKGAGIPSGTANRANLVMKHGSKETVEAMRSGKMKVGTAYEKAKAEMPEKKGGKVLQFPMKGNAQLLADLGEAQRLIGQGLKQYLAAFAALHPNADQVKAVKKTWAATLKAGNDVLAAVQKAM